MSEVANKDIRTANDNYFNYDVSVKAMKRLMGIMLYEIECLKENNPDGLAENHDEKVDITQFLEMQTETFKRHPEIKDDFSNEQIKDYKNLARELQKVINDNNRELTKAKTVNEEIIRLVANAVASKGNPVGNYNEIGKKSTTSTKRNPPSVTINEEI